MLAALFNCYIYEECRVRKLPALNDGYDSPVYKSVASYTTPAAANSLGCERGGRVRHISSVMGGWVPKIFAPSFVHHHHDPHCQLGQVNM